MEQRRPTPQEKEITRQTISELQRIGKKKLETGRNILDYRRRAQHYVLREDAQKMYEEIISSSLRELFPSPETFELSRYKASGILLTTEENSFMVSRVYPEFDFTFYYFPYNLNLHQTFRLEARIVNEERGIELEGYVFDERLVEQDYIAAVVRRGIKADKEQEVDLVRLLSSEAWLSWDELLSKGND